MTSASNKKYDESFEAGNRRFRTLSTTCRESKGDSKLEDTPHATSCHRSCLKSFVLRVLGLKRSTNKLLKRPRKPPEQLVCTRPFESRVRLQIVQRAMLQAVAARGQFKHELGSTALVKFDHPKLIQAQRGDPVAPPWQGILDAIRQSADLDLAPGRYNTLQYPELVNRAVQFFAKTCGIERVSAANIFIDNGSTALLDTLLASLGVEGKSALTGQGFYHTHAGTMANHDCELLCVPTESKSSFKLTKFALERWWTDASPELRASVRLLLIYNPQPKTGVLYTLEELRDVAEFAVAHQLLVVSDEVYRGTEHKNGKVLSIGAIDDIPSLDGKSVRMIDQTVTLYSLSKSAGAVSLRCGICCAPAGIVGHAPSEQSIHTRRTTLAKQCSFSNMSVNFPSQFAMTRAFDTPAEILLQNQAECSDRLSMIAKQLLPKLNSDVSAALKREFIAAQLVAEPQAALTVLLDFDALAAVPLPDGTKLRDSIQLAAWFRSYGVAVGPGYSLGFDNLFVALSYSELGLDEMRPADNLEQRKQKFAKGRQLLQLAFARLTEAVVGLVSSDGCAD